jgi:hypothetical protein
MIKMAQTVIRILLLSVVYGLCFPSVVKAHHAEATTSLDDSSRIGITGDVGVLSEAGDHPPALLFVFGYQGLKLDEDEHLSGTHVHSRYFWMLAQVNVSGDSTKDQSSLPFLDLNLVVKSKTVQKGTTEYVTRFAPSEFRRDLRSSLNFTMAIHSMGWSRYGEGPLYSGSRSIIFFNQLTGDVVGLRYAHLQTRGPLWGLQGGAGLAQAGLGWNFSEKAGLRLSVGGMVGLGGGEETQTKALDLLPEANLFSRLELFWNTALTSLRLSADYGYHFYQVIQLKAGPPELDPRVIAECEDPTDGICQIIVMDGHNHGDEAGSQPAAHVHDDGSLRYHQYLMVNFSATF